MNFEKSTQCTQLTSLRNIKNKVLCTQHTEFNFYYMY